MQKAHLHTRLECGGISLPKKTTAICIILIAIWQCTPAFSIDALEKQICDANSLELFNAAMDELEYTYGSRLNHSDYECGPKINYRKKPDPFLTRHTVFEFRIESGPHCDLQYIIAVNNDTRGTYAIIGIKDFHKILNAALSRLKEDPQAAFLQSGVTGNEVPMLSFHFDAYNDVIRQEDIMISNANVRHYIQSIFDLIFSKMDGLSDGMILDDIGKLKLKQNENAQKVKEMCKPVIAVEQENGFDIQATTWHQRAGIVLAWRFHVASNGEISIGNVEEIGSGIGEHSLCF